ncbi:2C and cyclic nucleotide-binding/kinase domain-containing protein [Seminavis robusta]|uniref:2C and cyclic nucleotide-binding/kinase domain-containing protein n=1 Tax=Seminavis robusta TaxID=568900 RepID=A0A9N8DTZ2_9STRA|nr:2C and cyclic nucleotide-binding/kinase domain-containing protein [Seminavis robusta]|eukprot:Sro369_g128280.1 2C and cyclic nucleotide-binding/kinase domain-containing protein (435) ;mRNA; f:60789-62093
MGCASSSEAKAVANDDQKENKKPTISSNQNNSNEKPATTTTDSSTTKPPNNGDGNGTTSQDTTAPKGCNTNSESSQEIVCGSLGPVRYACWSKRGKDPDDASKPNQDSFAVTEKFANDATDFFWGVYDGHGKTGADCSAFVRDNLPPLLVSALGEHFDLMLSTEQIHASLQKAHVQCNQQLHDNPSIDDSYSGTTSISVFLQGSLQRITIANVGDSRAILGTTLPDGKLMALPLSKDQTPRRPEEAQRVKQHGARILSFGEINGDGDNNCDDEDEDPPRVWAQNGKYPGTAFTRSLGDAIAERLGVDANPECMSLKLSDNEKFICLATDGIFDVMSNQEVVDYCMKHRTDPLEACKAIVNKSHEEWLHNEECEHDEDPRASYDDMTLICIFLNNVWQVGDKDKAADAPQTEEVAPHERRRRVRQKTLRNLEEME